MHVNAEDMGYAVRIRMQSKTPAGWEPFGMQQFAKPAELDAYVTHGPQDLQEKR
jgi:hypothetical protein